MYQMSSELPELYRRYYKKTFWSLFSRTLCRNKHNQAEYRKVNINFSSVDHCGDHCYRFSFVEKATFYIKFQERDKLIFCINTQNQYAANSRSEVLEISVHGVWIVVVLFRYLTVSLCYCQCDNSISTLN